MRKKRMAESANLNYLAPFGGITRIRFKGFVQDVSSNAAPPLFLQTKIAARDVNAREFFPAR